MNESPRGPTPPRDEQPDDFLAGRRRGGQVRRTGIALVHRGEFILPAPGSEAEIQQLEEDARTTINYHLPVEVEIVGALDEEQREEIVQEALRRLRRAIEGGPE